MKEQEKGDGSDGKESLKTKSDESGEEKNGDDDNQKSAQKKKGNAGRCRLLAQTGPGLSLPPSLQPKASWKCLLLTLWAQGYGLSAGIAVVGRCLQVLAEPSTVLVTGEAQAGAEGSDGCVGWG